MTRRSVLRFQASAVVMLLVVSCGAAHGRTRPEATLTRPGTAPAVPMTVSHSLGAGRFFLLHASVSRSPRPLVVALPMAFHTAATAEQAFGLSGFADTHGFVVAYGQGV